MSEKKHRRRKNNTYAALLECYVKAHKFKFFISFELLFVGYAPFASYVRRAWVHFRKTEAANRCKSTSLICCGSMLQCKKKQKNTQHKNKYIKLYEGCFVSEKEKTYRKKTNVDRTNEA